MHDIEPHFLWRHLYKAEKDPRSPFYKTQHSQFEFTNKVYNFVIHPQWDFFGSDTLLLKVLFVDYDLGYTIIELIGEWNDCINNDIMILKREIIDEMLKEGIEKFILLGENVLNFHASDDSYYQEWWEDTPGGWVSFVHFRDHILNEMEDAGIGNYIHLEENDENTWNWKAKKPEHLFEAVNKLFLSEADEFS
ncbi:MAG: hypothetical protein H6607_08900 [Flavobacteriales bacterium]|nr:hypothetical protein [Flavobacteriales bacterium]